MALAFISEAVASTFIGKLTEVACTVVGEHIFPEARDIEADLDRLNLALPQIKAILGAAERDEIKNGNEDLTEWMWQFRNAVECAEDVIDEMEYYELEENIQSNNEKVDLSASSSKRKFSDFVGSKLKADHNGILGRLQEVVNGLVNVASTVPNFLKIKSVFHGKNSKDNYVQNDRETGSMITESVVFGREDERDSIVKWLTVDPSVGDATLSAFTICGIGGMGKTTLAQLIYNDQKVKQFFDEIMWVCVSDEFNAVTIIAKALHMPKESYLTTVQDKLKERLRSKRFLLVLDDVWDDKNRSQWEILVASLKFGRGKIIITTRMESVADMIAKVIEGKLTDRLKLKGLEDDQLYMLLSKHAFDGADPNEFRNLHPIGKQIAKKLGGCPLAAKIMGGVLNYYMDLFYWRKVLKENVPEFLSGKDAIMGVLRLSYCHLPIYLQVCFRYCSIFPKDFVFKKSELIKIWMGSGLIKTIPEGQLPEDVGVEYFNRLVRKSFFDLKWTDKNNGTMRKFYFMHDLLHDLAQSVSKGECLRIEGHSSHILGTIRHLSLNMKNFFDINKILHLKRLRTLFISFESDNPDIEMSSKGLESLKSLRLLRIESYSVFNVPNEICKLIHLRYLSLYYPQQELCLFPESVCKLYHLQLISFKPDCEMNDDEAKAIVNLIKLRYLYLGSEINKKITNIGRLTFLQELEPLNIGPESSHMIIELKDLRSLRKLTITNLDKISNPVEAKDAKLYEKENLIKLSLNWSKNENGYYAGDEHKELIDNLQPHNHLQKLSINGYRGMRFPIWMTPLYLVNLIALKLSHCNCLKSLPALGKLPMLKELKLDGLCRVKKIDKTFYGGDGTECAFPVLKVLMLTSMNNLIDWDEAQGITLFPRLELLNVHSCRRLRRLPSLPPSIKRLDICLVGLKTLPTIDQHYKNGSILPSSLSYLSVVYCRDLTSLGGFSLQQQHGMQTLSFLRIKNCEKLMRVTLRELDPASLRGNFR